MAITDQQQADLNTLGYPNLAEACRAHNISLNTVYDRWIRRGWDLARALATPARATLSESVPDRRAREQEELRTGERYCVSCAKLHPLGSFRPMPKGSNGRDRECRECRYFYNIERTYGVTQAAFRALWDAQQGCCFGCLEELRLTTGSRENDVHLEHDHRTGKIRGLACRGCNWALGSFEDNPARLLQAALWLNRTCPVPSSWQGAVKSTCSGSSTDASLWNNHALTPGDYASMLEQQQGVCGICSTFPRTRKGWAVDHSERLRRELLKQEVERTDTSRGWRDPTEIRAFRMSVRGLLCDECNKGLGHVKENVETLRRLALKMTT